MATSRTIYKYHFKLGNKIVHTGITRDIDRREAEHRQKLGWRRGHIVQIGRRTTQEAALQWEAEQRRQGKPPGP
ncbi:MAG: GIY-YIG nuclease family protein [Gemmatimonadetes bacterium]|nr:GIY-YIG nuclease family protein [Gemmatimonadota bacterium]MXY82175.1 GIY-YIG nuclease family protein [Gemmatimonadota bacterium]MYB70819.1 GIY-YIG nuclease family protein [Gemmatimonadota bacterium]